MAMECSYVLKRHGKEIARAEHENLGKVLSELDAVIAGEKRWRHG